MAQWPEAFRRVDVFSVSGGVGKTLLAIHLAKLQAERANAPVLLVDADISGPCIGDLLEDWASPPWDTVDNLIHLICGRPEYLPEKLRPGKLPVYVMRDKCPDSPSEYKPKLATEPIHGKPAVLFCPSHPLSTNPRVELAVLHALIGHESAGGWIGYLIHQVIRETHRLMRYRLGGVIVDHAAAMGALQSATLREALEPRSADGAEADRRAIIMTTMRAPDPAAARDLAGRITALSPPEDRNTEGPSNLADKITWVVNCIPPEATDWRAYVKQRYPRNDAWLNNALPVRSDRTITDAEIPHSQRPTLDEDIENIRARIFG